jgi:hypothetical protein
MEDQWRVSKHNPEWKSLFNHIASKLRTSLGDLAIRIDHVGSTWDIIQKAHVWSQEVGWKPGISDM